MPDAKLTCRHFGIHHSYFYRWNGRYDKTRLASLENKPPVPKKLRLVLLRSLEAADVPRVSTLGRLISRENLFFRVDVKQHKKHLKAALKTHERKRKPYNLKADGARKLIEFDLKHVYLSPYSPHSI